MSNPSVIKIIGSLALGLAAHHTSACDFPEPSITRYAEANPGYVVFVGRVTSTTSFWRKWLGDEEASLVKVSAWYAGATPAKFVTVLHILAPDPKRYYCGPARGFSAREGDQLLIVGKQVGGAIQPEGSLIRSVGSEGLPVALVRELTEIPRAKLR